MAAKVITVFNQKGGCTKTMTSMQLSAAMGLRGFNVKVLDMDPQATATTWSAGADDPFPAQVLPMSARGSKVVDDIERFSNDTDIIIIDCPPAIESTIPWVSLLCADLGLIPVIPVMDNIWASKAASKLGNNAKQQNPDLKLAYLVNQYRRGKLFEACLAQLQHTQETDGIPVLENKLSLLNVYPESQAFGTSVHFKKSAAAKAIEEVEQVTTEVLALLGLPEKKEIAHV